MKDFFFKLRKHVRRLLGLKPMYRVTWEENVNYYGGHGCWSTKGSIIKAIVKENNENKNRVLIYHVEEK